jgi:hypothetical protein
MKTIYKYILLSTALIFVMGGCVEDEDLVTENTAIGGLVNPLKTAISYVVGSTDPYTLEFTVEQGKVNSTQIEIYKSFYDNGQGLWSDSEVLQETISISESKTHTVSTVYEFDDLVANMTVEGTPISVDDADYNIGDYWNFRIVATTQENNKHESLQGVKITVATRFAGIYTIKVGEYHHPDPANSGPYDGDRIIESVDAITYKFTDIGPWANEPDNYFYFTIDNDGNVDIPEYYNGELQLLWGTDPMAICGVPLSVDPDGSNWNTNAACINLATKMEDGKDVIEITYGYQRDSGTRTFNETLVKQ